jgi:WD40 repeat protein
MTILSEIWSPVKRQKVALRDSIFHQWPPIFQVNSQASVMLAFLSYSLYSCSARWFPATALMSYEVVESLEPVSVAWPPDGRYLTTASVDHKVMIWKVDGA